MTHARSRCSLRLCCRQSWSRNRTRNLWKYGDNYIHRAAGGLGLLKVDTFSSIEKYLQHILEVSQNYAGMNFVKYYSFLAAISWRRASYRGCAWLGMCRQMGRCLLAWSCRDASLRGRRRVPILHCYKMKAPSCDSNCNIHRPTCPTIHSVPAVNSYQPGADIQMKAAVDLPQQLRLRKSTSTSTSTSSTASKLDWIWI